MIRLTHSNKDHDEHFVRHERDIERIVRIFLARGFLVSKEEAYQAWCDYSDSYAAGWLILGDNDDEVFRNAMNYLEEQ